MAAASPITAKGDRSVLDDASNASYIEDKATGVKVPLHLINGVYTKEMDVATPAHLPRQAQKQVVLRV